MEKMKVYRRRNVRLRKGGYLTYSEYLSSPEWAALREKVLARDGRKCVACRGEARCVHHTKYSRAVLFATEPTPAMVSLCHKCHRFIEFNQDGTKTSADHALKKLRWLCRDRGTSLPGRCRICMKGGGSKHDGLCKGCRRRTVRQQNGLHKQKLPAVESDGGMIAKHPASLMG